MPPLPRYRADIDGMRAIAVMAVVFYYAGLGFLPGGFVGVDVFFIISGVLITRNIVMEMEKERVSGTAACEQQGSSSRRAFAHCANTDARRAACLHYRSDAGSRGKRSGRGGQARLAGEGLSGDRPLGFPVSGPAETRVSASGAGVKGFRRYGPISAALTLRRNRLPN